MIKKQARSKWFTTLVAVLNIAFSVVLIWKYEDIPLGWLVVLMLLWMVLTHLLDNNEKKSYVFSFYNQKITIDSRDFEEEEFAAFKARLQSVTDYWMDKQLSNGWPT